MVQGKTQPAGGLSGMSGGGLDSPRSPGRGDSRHPSSRVRWQAMRGPAGGDQVA